MSPKFPLLSSREIVNALSRLGFEKKGTKGSHRTYTKKSGDRTLVVTVPIGKRQIPRNTLRSILSQARVTLDEFESHIR